MEGLNLALVKLKKKLVYVVLDLYFAFSSVNVLCMVVCAPACLAHKTSVPARQGNIEHFQAYLSIFEVF